MTATPTVDRPAALPSDLTDEQVEALDAMTSGTSRDMGNGVSWYDPDLDAIRLIPEPEPEEDAEDAEPRVPGLGDTVRVWRYGEAYGQGRLLTADDNAIATSSDDARRATTYGNAVIIPRNHYDGLPLGQDQRTLGLLKGAGLDIDVLTRQFQEAGVYTLRRIEGKLWFDEGTAGVTDHVLLPMDVVYVYGSLRETHANPGLAPLSELPQSESVNRTLGHMFLVYTAPSMNAEHQYTADHDYHNACGVFSLANGQRYVLDLTRHRYTRVFSAQMQGWCSDRIAPVHRILRFLRTEYGAARQVAQPN